VQRSLHYQRETLLGETAYEPPRGELLQIVRPAIMVLLTFEENGDGLVRVRKGQGPGRGSGGSN
jgi:hypothetical protein